MLLNREASGTCPFKTALPARDGAPHCFPLIPNSQMEGQKRWVDEQRGEGVSVPHKLIFEVQ